jgi:hypothetical protein
MAENYGFRAKFTVFKNMRYCQEYREGNGWLIILAERFADARGLRLAGRTVELATGTAPGFRA